MAMLTKARKAEVIATYKAKYEAGREEVKAANAQSVAEMEAKVMKRLNGVSRRLWDEKLGDVLMRERHGVEMNKHVGGNSQELVDTTNGSQLQR